MESVLSWRKDIFVAVVVDPEIVKRREINKIEEIRANVKIKEMEFRDNESQRIHELALKQLDYELAERQNILENDRLERINQREHGIKLKELDLKYANQKLFAVPVNLLLARLISLNNVLNFGATCSKALMESVINESPASLYARALRMGTEKTGMINYLGDNTILQVIPKNNK